MRKPLSYLIGADIEDIHGDDARVTEVPYDDRRVGDKCIAYCNLFHETYEEDGPIYAPYLPDDDTSGQYNEGRIDPRGQGWRKNLDRQYALRRSQGHDTIELDNPDSYDHFFDYVMEEVANSGFKIIAKNPQLLSSENAQRYVTHPNVVGVIVERSVVTPAMMHMLRVECGKPDLPIWFVAYDRTMAAEGWYWANDMAEAVGNLADMGVTYSERGEYTNVSDVLPYTGSSPQEPSAMRIVISAGHSKYVSGANGYVQEFEETSRVTRRVAEILEGMGALAGVFIDEHSTTQNENLNAIVNYHNSKTRDWDIAVHFNSNGTTQGPLGCEVWHKSSKGGEMAVKIVNEICDESGLKNRGKKQTDSLFFLNETEMPACLIEVCFVTSRADTDIYESTFEDICGAIASALTGQEVESVPPEPQPPRPPTDEHPTIKKGSNGDEVAVLQESLGCLIADGDFGSITDTWVRAFQAASDLAADGIVGPMTWEEVDDLDRRVEEGDKPLPKALADQIVAMAKASDIQDYLWDDRGMTPPGYIPGMALCFAYAMRRWHDGDDAVTVMAKAAGNPDKDALAWYEAEFRALGMSNAAAGLDTLRHLFVMMIGLGPRESSGRYCEGRDLSASNVQSDTAEAGLFQTSWNIRSFSDAIGPLLGEYWANPNGFREVFKENVDATKNNLDSYGHGDGIRYQWLSRFAPLFHALVTGVGMRTGRAHWGPIGRREVEIKREADDLLKQVQHLVEAQV